jgi:hypothetical protein
MSLPDNDELRRLIAAATPGKWEWRYAKHRQSLRVMRPKEGCQESYTIILETDGDRDDADYRGATKADCELIVHALAMAAEVIRLRDALTEGIRERDGARREFALARQQGFGTAGDDGGEWIPASEMKEVK